MIRNKLDFSVEFTKSSILFFDKTGAYHISRNKTGWGKPNLDTGDVRSEIHIYYPGGEAPLVYFPTDPIPTKDSSEYLEIKESDFDTIESLPSGVYKIDYICYYNNDTEKISKSCSFLFEKKVKCCLDERKLKVNIHNTDSDDFKFLCEGETLLSVANLAFEKGSFDEANEILNYLENKCDCGCC